MLSTTRSTTIKTNIENPKSTKETIKSTSKVAEINKENSKSTKPERNLPQWKIPQ